MVSLTDDYAGRAPALNPDHALAIAARANIRGIATTHRAARHDLGDVIADFQRAVAIDPPDSSVMNWLGMPYAHVGYTDAALEAFTACADFDPLFGE